MRFLKGVLLLGVIAVSYYFYVTGGFYRVLDYFNKDLDLPELSLQSFKDVKEKSREFLPQPLIKKDGTEESKVLTVQGILEETNRHRKENGLPPLVLNEKLSVASKIKTEDMFKNQYFEHESLEGKSASDLVSEANYEYLVVGENLAMGHFKDEVDLVTAWMNSPGHRANILGSQFQEIGIYVSKGKFKGDTVWMSVQEFATPAYVCPRPFESDKNKITEDIASLEEINEKLIDLKRAISSTNKNDPNYNKLVESYNLLVKKYNEGTSMVRLETEKYNIDVRAYNKCIENFSD